MIAPLKTNAYATLLMRLVEEVIGDLLDHLAAIPDGQAIDRAAFLADVREGSQLLDPLETLMDAVLSNTTQRQRRDLVASFRNDICFDRRIDVRTFRFSYPMLPALVRKWATPLFRALYDTLSDTGFVVKESGRPDKTINRRVLEEGFFARNPGIRACPVCLESGLALSPTGAQSTNDCDHFLPKFRYGPLSLHPQNLLFMCPLCNGRRKGVKDPLTGRNGAAGVAARTRAGALRTTYLPYRRPAVRDLQLTFARGSVTLGSDTGLGRERVGALDRVFGLARAWSALLPPAESEMFEAHENRCRRPPTSTSVIQELEATERRGFGPVERLDKGVFLRGRYARYLREEHLVDLTADWQQRSRDLRASVALYSTAYTSHPRVNSPP